MKKNVIIPAFILVAILAPGLRGQSADAKSQLVGVWQNSQGVGSGLTDNYQFFDDGTFRFNYNEMDGTKRVLSYSGFWNVYKNRLHVHISRVTIHIGGRWQPATGSIATDYEIVGGRVIAKKISPVEKLSYSLSAFGLEEEVYTTVMIGNEKFWKLSSDPKAYEN